MGVATHQVIMNGNRVCVGLIRSTIGPVLPSLFPVKGTRMTRLHDNEPLVALMDNPNKQNELLVKHELVRV